MGEIAMFRWFEERIDPFSPFDENETPPSTMGRFAWHYLKPAKHWYGILFIMSLIVGFSNLRFIS